MTTTAVYLVFVIFLLIGQVICNPPAEEVGEKVVGKIETWEDESTDQDLVDGKNRVKRYPEHLDPNYPLWVRIGECPSSLDGNKQHFCPTPTPGGRWICVDDYQLCDGIKNCPNAEDESSNYCLFYKVLKSEVEMLTRSISTLRKEEATAAMAEGIENNLIFDDEGESKRFHRQSGPFVPAH